MKNILLIRLKAIGDVVLTLPAVQMIRDNFPDAKITFLTSKENAGLLGGFREVNEVIAVDRAALRGGNPLRVIPEFFGLLGRLRAGKFDLAVDLHGIGETGWLARVTGAPQRWGPVQNAGRGRGYTRKIPHVSQLHAGDWHLRMLEECGLKPGTVRNEFALPEPARAAARTWFADHRLDLQKRTLYLQPLTSGAHKNWPLENYLAVARQFQSAGAQIIIGGGPTDQNELEPARREGFEVTTGVSLLVTAGLMQLATLVVGGDTGALHLAVAQGKRVLMLMHDASPGSPMPFHHPEWVVAAPRPEAIGEITVDEVGTACERAMAEIEEGLMD